MPVILATQEAEIRTVIVQSQPWENNSSEPVLKTHSTKDWQSGSVVVHLSSKCKALSSTPVLKKNLIPGHVVHGCKQVVDRQRKEEHENMCEVSKVHIMRNRLNPPII
jgi:hypothetical protein